MHVRPICALLLTAFVVPFEDTAATKPGDTVLRTVADVPMPGPPVRFDYQSLDPASGRLYIAHMNANQLVVFDTANRKVVANLDGFARVHGVIAVPELGRVYASATGDHRVNVVDEETLQVIARVGPIPEKFGMPALDAVIAWVSMSVSPLKSNC